MERIKLVLVTKRHKPEEILRVLGKYKIKRIAENRLEEAEEKFPYLPNLEKHYIGKLQSRKIKKIFDLFDVIQTVETFEQAEKINSLGKKRIMIQINIANLPQRSGVQIDDAKKLISEIKKLENIELIGVMGMASQDETLAKKEFQHLKSLQNGLQECSMGMSDDFQIAIEEGSTMLRLGRILFEDNLPTELKYE